MSFYSAPGTVLSTSQALSHLLSPSPSNMAQAPQPVSGRAGIQTAFQSPCSVLLHLWVLPTLVPALLLPPQASCFVVLLIALTIYLYIFICIPGSSDDKASAYNAGDLGSIPGSGRSPGEGNGNPLQYSCLENPMDLGAWWATIHGVAKSRT